MRSDVMNFHAQKMVLNRRCYQVTKMWMRRKWKRKYLLPDPWLIHAVIIHFCK